jgi:hypothetical protein
VLNVNEVIHHVPAKQILEVEVIFLLSNLSLKAKTMLKIHTVPNVEFHVTNAVQGTRQKYLHPLVAKIVAKVQNVHAKQSSVYTPSVPWVPTRSQVLPAKHPITKNMMNSQPINAVVVIQI